jgi:hydroxymethylpyrimidine pyrophosphatase-like HAD family hydrolase
MTRSNNDSINDDATKEKRKKNSSKLIRAIFSDYDGTLCSASAVRDPSLGQNRIPREIKKVLQEIAAEQIPVCIISSKDYFFLKETRAFARVLSCMMGIETLTFADNSISAKEHQSPPPIRRRLMWGEEESDHLFAQSNTLEEIAERIETEPDFRSIIVERKYTYDRRILSGITVDWRYSNDWDYYKRSVRHSISALITNLSRQPVPIHLYLQKYDFHPFVDVYVAECNKGIAFDLTLSEISSTAVVYDSRKQNNDDNRISSSNNDIRSIREEDVLYLGDSENDKPAFRKAGVSIGVRSDSRINPKLECQHTINFDRLAKFLQKLKDNNLRFKEEQLIN